MKLTKKSTMETLITVWQTTSILIVGANTATKITVIRPRETVSIVIRPTAAVNNNNNSSNKENNINRSNIISKINIKNIDNNSKENNISSNGGNNSTNNKRKQANYEDNSISNNNNNSCSKENNINSSNIHSKTRNTAFIIGESIVKQLMGIYRLQSWTKLLRQNKKSFFH